MIDDEIKAGAIIALATLRMEIAQLPKGGIQQHNLRVVENFLKGLVGNDS